MKVRKVLTIAGSDSGGGAGIQADLKTFQELDVYGMSVITAVTAQNTIGVQGVYPMSEEAVLTQLDSIGSDLEPDAVKTGMLVNSDIIKAVTSKVKQYSWNGLVVDPVMVAKGGSTLLQKEALDALRTWLIPYANVITPNIPEAEVLAEMKIEKPEDRKKAAKLIYKMGASHVIIKGGHDADGQDAIDLLYDGMTYMEFSEARVNTVNTHGTGCTFSAAIAAEMAKGNTVQAAVRTAKAFIHAAIEEALDIGSGQGPTNHSAYRRRVLVRGIHA